MKVWPPFTPPAWFASMMQIPMVVKVTVPLLIEQILDDEESMLRDGVRPDVEVAVTLYDPIPGAATGAVDVNEIFWVCATMNAC